VEVCKTEGDKGLGCGDSKMTDDRLNLNLELVLGTCIFALICDFPLVLPIRRQLTFATKKRRCFLQISQ